LYDHLRYVPRHKPVVLCDHLENREEFPLLEARHRDVDALARRVWRRLRGNGFWLGDSRWIRKADPLVLHSHFGFVGAEDFALQKLLGVPWLVSFYGADIYEYGRSRQWIDQYARLFAHVDLVLALGPQMALGLADLGCPTGKIVVHPLGVDVDAIAYSQRVLKEGDVLRLLFAGTFREKKGVEYVIRGAAEARRRGVNLHVTLVGDATPKPGDAETKASIFREIDRLDMHDVVTHHGYVQFDALMKMSQESHVFVAPSVTSATGDAEGTPFVLQQMMASGIPVIATVHSDIPFLFGGHRNQLVAERDSQAIADRLQQYAEEPDLVSRDGATMREQIETAFDVRTHAASLSEIYDAAGSMRSTSPARAPDVTALSTP
jgi:colanic acid/amylovoran biosynthesis glycosyltransferase